MKKISIVFITLILILQFSSFALASEYNINNITKDNGIQSKDLNQSNYTTDKYIISQKQLDYLLENYVNNTTKTYDIINADIIYKDLTNDGIYELIILYQDFNGEKYLEIYTPVNNKITRIFSGYGDHINIDQNSFSITNTEFDGRYFYETYTYRWRNGKFLRTGYSKTYIRDNEFFWELPTQKNNPSWNNWPNGNTNKTNITRDERILTVENLLKARMTGNINFSKNYLSKNFKKDIDNNKLRQLIPYGKVSNIDIFESQRDDWVVVVINDRWGQSRVFKFVPIKEKDQYGNYKIDQIKEIPRAN